MYWEIIHGILRCAGGITISSLLEKLGFGGNYCYGRNWIVKAVQTGQMGQMGQMC